MFSSGYLHGAANRLYYIMLVFMRYWRCLRTMIYPAVNTVVSWGYSIVTLLKLEKCRWNLESFIRVFLMTVPKAIMVICFLSPNYHLQTLKRPNTLLIILKSCSQKDSKQI